MTDRETMGREKRGRETDKQTDRRTDSRWRSVCLVFD